jgi:hypothetical protein
MPKFRPKYKELIAMEIYSELIIELPDGEQFRIYAPPDGSGKEAFLKFWEEIPAEETSPDPDPLNRLRIRTVLLDLRGKRDCWCFSDDQPGQGHHDDKCWDVQNAVAGNGDHPPYNFDRDESGLLMEVGHAET